MIKTVMYCSWLNLKRDKVALALSFLLPVIFFSVFAAIFGGMGKGGGGRKLAVVIVDEDQSAYSAAFMAEIAKLEAMRVVSDYELEDGSRQKYDATSAEAAVQMGKKDAALVLGKGLEGSVGFAATGEPAITLFYDPANPLACEPVRGMLQQVGMSANPTSMMDKGLALLEQYGGPLTDAQRVAMEGAKASGGGSGLNGELVPIRAVDVKAKQEKAPNMTAYYAAGIGVMFLLFSMSGAGGGLLEEAESGTLDRLLGSRLGMNRLIMGKWLFFAVSGVAQLAVMFLWGAIAFGLELFTRKHLAGFALITVTLSLAGAAFGLFLATLAKSRAQLSGISTVVILLMSAVGGSMIPRMVMSETMLTLGKFTINGWAIDGYLKIFWNEVPTHTLPESIAYILPEAGMLCLFAAGFLAVALSLSRRWQAT